MGDLSLTNDDTAHAILYFQKAWSTNPHSPLAASELGVALMSAGKGQEAEQQFQRALEIDPKYTDARYNLASAEATNGEWKAAAENYKEVTAEKPDNAKARQHLGEVLYLWADDLAKAGNDTAAVAHYREALAFRPDDAGLHTSLGTALVRMRRVTEARSEFEIAVRLDPNFQPAKEALQAMQAQ
jgi:Flp pilus assembly protein TadD